MGDNPYAKYANPYAGYVPVGIPDPKKPLELQSAQLGIARTQQEIDLANRTAAATAAKAAADAQTAQINAKTAQEQYAAQHTPVNDSGLYGDAYLKTVSPSDSSMIKALSEGRLAFPTGAALRSPFWQEKLSQVSQFDPTFDATNFNARAKGRASAISGKLGASNNALNTAMGHLGTLETQISGTASHNFTPLNAVENFASKMFGDPGVTNFQDTANKLADELESVYRNGGGAESGVVRQLRGLDANASQAQKEGIIKNAMDLLASKQAANLAQYNFGTGGKPAWNMLDQHTQDVLNSPQFRDIRDKYFAAPAGAPPHPGGNDAPPPIGPQSGPSGAPAAPQADYSSMTGVPGAALVGSGDAYRREFDPAMAGAVSAFIRHGAPYETVAAYTQSHGLVPPDPKTYAAAVTFAQQHHGATNVEANKLIPTTMGERLSSSPVAAGLAGAASAGTAGFLDAAGRSLAGPAWDANRAALADTNPSSDLIGNVIGGAGAMLGAGELLAPKLAAGAKGGLGRNALAFAARNPVKAGALGDGAYGAIYGANENPDNPLAGAGVGALGGIGGGMFGAAGSKVAGKVVGGVVNPAVRRLNDAGIPLTVGEVLGGGAKKAQDAMTSVFGPGSMVLRRYEDGRLALNKAGFQQAGNIVGQPVDAVGHAGIQALKGVKDNAYSNALDPVTLNASPQFANDALTARNAAQAIPPVDQARDIATGAIDNYILNPILNSGGTLSGRDFQQGYRGLARTAGTASPRLYGHEIGQALGQGQDALAGALEDQNPGAYQGFLKANSVNRHLSVLADAVNAAKNQIGPNGEPLWTPAQLGTAASSNARTFSGKVAAASGNRPFNQLAMDAQQVMSSKLPESGTFPRQLMGMAITGGAGGMFGGSQNGYEGAAEGAAVPLGLLTLLGTRGGQKLLTSALLKRTLADQVAGRAMLRNPQVGGSILTAAGIPLLTGPQAQ